jgi:hypothetical protein
MSLAERAGDLTAPALFMLSEFPGTAFPETPDSPVLTPRDHLVIAKLPYS